MKRAALICTYLLLPLISAGCVVMTDGGDSELRVSWNLVRGDANTPTACPASVTTAAVVTEPLDDGDAFLGDGDETYDLFDCASATALTGTLAPGSYDVWVDLLDAQGGLVAQSGYQTVTLDFDETLDVGFDVSLDRGSFGLTWTITDGDASLTCDEVGGEEILVASTLVGPDETGYDDLFACVDGQAITPALPLGDYDVSVILLDRTGAAMHPAVRLEERLEFGNEFKDLGNFEFVLEP